MLKWRILRFDVLTLFTINRVNGDKVPIKGIY